MIDVLLTGVGGQGTVLAARVLASAACAKGWQVRSAETIGMAQRGGSVISHVRMGSCAEPVYAPLVTRQTADLIVAFEPAEAARQLPYLAKDGVLVSATTAIRPVSASISETPYRVADILKRITDALSFGQSFVPVDDAAVTERIGSRKVLNTVLLASALAQGRIPISIDDLRCALADCLKARYLAINLRAVDEALAICT